MHRQRLGLIAPLCARWPRIAPVALVASTPLLGCGPGGFGGFGGDGGDSGPFRITDVHFDGDATITLTFSKPIANADEIDPNDFRISVATTYRFNYTDPDSGMTYVKEASFYADVGPFYGGDYARFNFASASLGTENQLMLEGEETFGIGTCQGISYYEMAVEMWLGQYGDGEEEIGMFLHYAASDIPVQSEAGETIADIGRDWVLTDELGSGVPTFGFPKLMPRLEIPCP